MKIGDYVRNKYGIAKIVDIENKNDINILKFDRDICFMVDKKTGDELYRMKFLPLTEHIDIDKINFSSSIIDLIEVGDYVNGYLVTDVSFDAYGKKIVFVGQRKNEEMEYHRSYYDEEIKSVVTKEQFKKIEYLVKY